MRKATRSTVEASRTPTQEKLTRVVSENRDLAAKILKGKARAEGAPASLQHRAASTICALELQALLAESALGLTEVAQAPVLRALAALSEDVTGDLLVEVMAKLPSVADTERTIQLPLEATA